MQHFRENMSRRDSSPLRIRIGKQGDSSHVILRVFSRLPACRDPFPPAIVVDSDIIQI